MWWLSLASLKEVRKACWKEGKKEGRLDEGRDVGRRKNDTNGGQESGIEKRMM